MVLRSAITASSSATPGQTANNLPGAWGAEVVTYKKSTPRKGIHLLPQRAATVGWRKEKTPIPQIIGAADTQRMRCRKTSCRGHPGPQREGRSLPTSQIQACPSRRRSGASQRNRSSLRHIRWQVSPLWNPGSL
jgi:hypothetical protein